jgi:small conductance mechanosensitive channel
MSIHEEIGVVESQLKDQGQRVATIARVAAQAITLVIYIATSLLVLDALTVDIGPILGGAAIFGLAISFGSQSLVKDVVSGFFILLENQYAVGDVVNINGQSGGVEKVTLRRTVLRNAKGEVHNLTNGSITSVTNMTQGWARVVMHLGVAYGTDIEYVESVVNEVGEAMYAEEEWRSKLTEKPSFVGVTAFGESEVTIRVWCKTKTFQNWSVERELNIRLKTAFEKADIEIPFPKRDINLIISKPDLIKSISE